MNSNHRTTPAGIAYDTGGEGSDLLLLVHGLGAHATVWEPMLRAAAGHPAASDGLAAWPGTWATPDLRGHGRSVCQPPYSYGAHVADLATVVAEVDAASVTVVGHSLGGVLGALLASDVFGVPVRAVVAIGVKLDWTAEEIAGARRLAQRDRVVFGSYSSAATQALKLAGLRGLAEADDPRIRDGVRQVPDGFTAAADPRVFSVVGPEIRGLLSLCRAPLHLAAGSADPMTSLEAMQTVDPDATLIDPAGHNAHWEQPASVWQLLSARTRSARGTEALRGRRIGLQRQRAVARACAALMPGRQSSWREMQSPCA